MLSILLSCVLAADPSVYWARVTPTDARQLWVYGEELWAGSPQRMTPGARAWIGEDELTWIEFRSGSNVENNFATPYCLTFSVPASVASGLDRPYRITRNDGAEFGGLVDVPEACSIDRVPIGQSFQYVTRAETVAAGCVADFKGAILYVDGRYQDRTKPVITLEEGAELANVRIIVEQTGPRVPCVRVAGDRVRVKNVELANYHEATGYSFGIALDIPNGTTGSTFHDLRLHAERGVSVGSTTAERSRPMRANNWIGVDYSSPRGVHSGEMTRSVNGPNNLWLRCSWHDCDRGPISQSGQPVDANVFWECSQFRTGLTVGGSEGLFFEQGRGMWVEKPLLTTGVYVLAPFELGKKIYVAPGQIVAEMAGRAWAFIEESKVLDTEPKTVAIRLTKPIAWQGGPVWIGGAATRNLVARCDFRSGRNGVIWWGPSIENRVVGCAFQDLRSGIIQLDTDGPRPNGTIGFEWGAVVSYPKVHRATVDVLQRWVEDGNEAAEDATR